MRNIISKLYILSSEIQKLAVKKYKIGDTEYIMKEIVKMKSWQKLREVLKGTWAENKEANVRKLRRWLGPVTKTTTKKLLIIRNYLTGSGFRWGNIQHSSISKFREQVVKELKKRQKKD